MKSSVRALGATLAISGLFGLIYYVQAVQEHGPLLIASAGMSVMGALMYFAAKTLTDGN